MLTTRRGDRTSTPAEAEDTARLFAIGATLVIAAAFVGLRVPILGFVMISGATLAISFGVYKRIVRFMRKRAGKKALHDRAFVVLQGSALLETLQAFKSRTTWLALAQEIARMCARNDEVADLCGEHLRELLWAGRFDLGTDEVNAALTQLRDETKTYLAERLEFERALAVKDTYVDPSATDREIRLDMLTQESRRAAEKIRFESEVIRSTRIEISGR
jgi:hypothetical protein